MTPADAQTLQDDAIARDGWLTWIITAGDLEHPGRVTARARLAEHHGGLSLPGALVADTLEDLRTMLPSGLECHGRTSRDPPDVIEVWE